MKNFKFRLMALLVVALLAAFTPPPVRAEGYFYQGNRGFSVSFSLIGGPYSIYLYARRPQNYSSASRECIFGGNLQRVWPTQDAISLGSGLTISTIVPHKIGPKTLMLPPGLYRIYIAPLTDCDWHFSIVSTNQNAAGHCTSPDA